ncbi:MAG: ABC transporter substrate-binding protein [Pseudomonadota bacterium]
MIKRRSFLAATLAGVGAWALWALPAQALDEGVAKAHIEQSISDVLGVVQSGGDASSKAVALQSVMEKRAAMPQIARFAAGRAWRDMSEDQQKRYTEAFSRAVSVAYARRFQNYAGEQVEVGDAKDRSKRGILISSLVTQPQGAPIAVDWLVSDRPGRVVIADIVIEGVSLLITQRDEIAGMLGKRGGDVDKLIEDLNAI